MATLTRRAALAATIAASIAAVPAAAPAAQAQKQAQKQAQEEGGEFWLDLRDDWGGAIPNLRVPSVLDPFQLPGLLWFGPAAADVHLFEFFDYNCGSCRAIAPHLDRMVRETPGLRLGLVHNPILSPQSREAARAALAVLRMAGPREAYEMHMRLYRSRGTMDGQRAKAVARDLGVDIDSIPPEVGGIVDSALDAQEKLASGLGFSVSPSFVINGMGLFGNPGPQSLASMVEAVRRCDALVCP